MNYINRTPPWIHRHRREVVGPLQSVLGGTQRGGPAAVLQSAATVIARGGHVGRAQITGPVTDAGATVVEAELGGRRVVTESIGGQVVSKMVTPAPAAMTDPPAALDKDAVTIGRALEAVVAMSGDRSVDQSDAAVIQVAETPPPWGRSAATRGGHGGPPPPPAWESATAGGE